MSLDPAAVRFFVPGTTRSGAEAEYGRLRASATRHTGTAPLERRIRSVAFRVKGRDCTIEVGRPDPVDGGEVLAIFDLGRHHPYGVFTAADRDAPSRLVVKPVYSVTDFA